MMPDTISDELIKRYKTFATYEDMEIEIHDFLERNDQRKTGKGKVNAVSADDKKSVSPPGEKEEMTYQDVYDENYGGWICLATPAMKRQRTEENYDERPLAPAAGCFNCGGAHYVKDCPEPKQEGKGKGKGEKAKGKGKGKGGKPKGKGKAKGNGKDWNTVQPKYWSEWNPGFQNAQWNYWRPG